ncbi:MAG: thioesterase family protein [Pseudomonadota bacterium]|nr:thioesterase family protein [Pseudomonadota bacterium]
MSDTKPVPCAPLSCPTIEVISEWIDYNGHMNMAYYNVAFDRYGTDYLLDQLGLGIDYVQRENASTFTLEQHVSYLRELRIGDPIHMTCQLLDYDSKRVHCFLNMYHAKEDYLAATSEQILMHVDLDRRRGSPLPDVALKKLAAMNKSHGQLPRPPQAGHVIAIRRG